MFRKGLVAPLASDTREHLHSDPGHMHGETIGLRPVEEEDLALVRQWNFDPEISRYFTSRWPVSMAEQRNWFNRQVNTPDKRRLIITDRMSGQAIGLVGIMGIDHVNKNCEVGITIGDRAYWGQPHAGETMRLVLKFLFGQFNMHLVYLRVMQDNARALAFFEKCGFARNGVLRDMIFADGAYHSWVWMSITQVEFASRSAGFGRS
jgi:diamine N-acetyltransferase